MTEVTNYTLHKYMTKNQYGEDVMHVSGVAAIELKNPRGDNKWHGFEVEIPLDTAAWASSRVEVPSIALGSISNDGHAVDAGWAADEAQPWEIRDIPYMKCKLALKDKDGRLHRVNFTAIVVGWKSKLVLKNALAHVSDNLLEEALKNSQEARKKSEEATPKC